LFWDGRHPTAIGHDILANAAADDVIDSNGDGIPNNRALALGLDPFVANGDSDFDGTSDVVELGELDNPLDTDGDGIINAAEPGDAASDPRALVFRVPDVCCQFPSALRGKTVSLMATGADTMVSVNNPDWRLPIYAESQVGFDAVFNYPSGLYSFTLMVSTGGTATIVLQFPADVGIPADAVYRRVDAAGGFSTENRAEINQTNKTITLTLTDGGRGDEDGSTDGVILQTGGIGQPVSFDVPDLDLDFGFGGGAGGCFIATAAYGSYQAPYVQILRNFRDRFLLPNAVGRWLVGQYYTYSPPAAAWIAQRDGWRALVRMVLLPLIGIAWLLTEVAAGIQILVGLLLLGLLWCMAGYLRTRHRFVSPAK
jgi:hypothetical protein